MTAVGWMKPDAPRREDRKEKPLLAWGRGGAPITATLFGGLRPPGGRPIPLLRAFLGRKSDIYWIFRQPAPADIHVRMEPRSASCLTLPANLT
jgi:hypothetical protein